MTRAAKQPAAMEIAAAKLCEPITALRRALKSSSLAPHGAGRLSAASRIRHIHETIEQVRGSHRAGNVKWLCAELLHENRNAAAKQQHD